jgi:prolyl oligopeptidase
MIGNPSERVHLLPGLSGTGRLVHNHLLPRARKSTLCRAQPAVLENILMQENPLSYPPSRIDNIVDQVHGVAVPDPYRWLEDAESTEVKEWVARQNALTRQVLDAVPGHEVITARLDALLDVGSIGTPAPRKGRYFYTRREGKQNQPVLYVRQGLRGPDRPLVDVNALAADGTVALDWWYPSRDGRLLAYGLSEHGSEQSTLHVRDVLTGADLPDTITRTRACSLAWLPDGSGFYYTRYPEAGTVPAGEENYHRHLYRHALGTDPATDPVVFGIGRPAEDWADARLSPGGRWLVVTESKGWSRTEVYLRDLHDPQGDFRPLMEGVEALFHVTVRDDRFYVHTNEGAPRYRLFRVDPLRPDRADWKEVIPEGEDVLEGVAVIGDVLVADYMSRASSRLRLFEHSGTLLHEVPLPVLGTLAGLGGEWDGDEFLFGFQSFTVPASIYHVDLKTLPGPVNPVLWDRVAVNIDLDNYTVEQAEYPSMDGTPVTMFLAYRKGLMKDGNNPTLLYGYGGFNISLTPLFSSTRFVFLERGGLLAVANLRGGGEYGETWHQAGMLGNKQHVFDDFLAAAGWLIDQSYTGPEHLVAQGGSNGGLLVGAALTQRPDLFRAVVCQVPLLDMVRYHRFLIARLWVPEYGSADDREQFCWLYSYSPYRRVRDGERYPAVLLATAESDTRVDALHARKMTARLQAASASGQPILLRLEPKAGHGAGKPRSKVLEELSDVWSFVFWQLGLSE